MIRIYSDRARDQPPRQEPQLKWHNLGIDVEHFGQWRKGMNGSSDADECTVGRGAFVTQTQPRQIGSNVWRKEHNVMCAPICSIHVGFDGAIRMGTVCSSGGAAPNTGRRNLSCCSPGPRWPADFSRKTRASSPAARRTDMIERHRLADSSSTVHEFARDETPCADSISNEVPPAATPSCTMFGRVQEGCVTFGVPPPRRRAL